MTLDHREGHLDKLRSALSIVTYPIHMLADIPSRPFAWLGEALTPTEDLQDELERLRTQQLILRNQLQKMIAIETENRRLRELFNASLRLTDKTLVAEIISVDLDPFAQKVIINKGSLEGVYPGQSILDAEGVLGQIIYAEPYTSVAMLISDPNHAIPVQVNRNGLRAIAVGTGSADELDIPYILNNADIQVGDQLLTSGLGGRFPQGYPVGIITYIEKKPGEPYALIKAKPTALLDRSREVLLVQPANRHQAATTGTQQ
jgi:rod shape-determining protein MreC